jgi:AhpD family alkylhydroperoxidase
MSTESFRKRYLDSPWRFFVLLWRAHAAFFRAIVAGRGGRVSRAFAERVNLAVSGVSECAYCSHLHARLALESGVPDDEVRAILGGDLEGCPVEEAPVLAYAVHWAESGGRPEAEARDRAVERAGESIVRRAEAVMATVYLGNMCSNAVEARRAGVRPGFVAFLAFLLAWPVAMVVKTWGRYPG